MPGGSALAKENSIHSEKLVPTAAKNKLLDRQQLVQELLSLGNPRITPEVAGVIGQEVAQELTQRPAPRVTADLVSELVQFKLQELGLVKIKAPLPASPRAKIKTGGTPLPTLEKFLRKQISSSLVDDEVFEKNEVSDAPKKIAANSQVKAQPESTKDEKDETKGADETNGIRIFEAPKVLPLPPRAEVKLKSKNPGLQKVLEKLFTEQARQASFQAVKFNDKTEADSKAKSKTSFRTQVQEIEFFNLQANQEFYLHSAQLWKILNRKPAFSLHGKLLTIPADFKKLNALMTVAKKFWQRGFPLVFDLDALLQAKEFNLPKLEQVFEAIEESILALPDSIPMPSEVGLQVSARQPLAREVFRRALSGQYYPQFRPVLKLDRVQQSSLGLMLNEQNQVVSEFEGLATLFHELWKKSSPCFVLNPQTLEKITGSLPRVQGSLNLASVVTQQEVDWRKLRRVVQTAVLFVVSQAFNRKKAKATSTSLALGVMGFAQVLNVLKLSPGSEAAGFLAAKLMRFVRREAEAKLNELIQNASETSRANFNFKLSFVVQPEAALAELMGVNAGIDLAEAAVQSLATQLKLQSSWQQHASGLVQLKLRDHSSKFEDLIKLLIEAATQEIAQVELAQQPYLKDFVVAPDFLPEPEVVLEEEEEVTEIISQAELKAEVENILTTVPQVDSPTQGQKEETEIEVTEAIKETEIHPDEILDLFLAEATPTPTIEPRARPEVLQATTRQINTAYGPMSVTLGCDEQGPYEFRAHLGKSGSTESAQAEALSRLITLLLSVGVNPKRICEELIGIREASANYDQEAAQSVADAVAQALVKELNLNQAEDSSREVQENEEEETTEVIQL